MVKIDEKNYLSDKGMVFKHIKSGRIYGWGINLGINDSIDNYEEIECPQEYIGNLDFDNASRFEKNERKIKERTQSVESN